MTLTVIVTIQSAADAELAQRVVAGRPWLVRLIERLSLATSVQRIVIACRERASETAALLDSTAVSVVTTDDPIATARGLEGDHDGVAFCPVAQLFADPVRLDAIAALEIEPDTARAFAALSCDPSISLTGGAFLEVVTRVGLRADMGGDAPGIQKTVTWRTSPAPPEMRLPFKTWGDIDWATRADEVLLAQDPSGALVHFEDALRVAGLHRFSFWDDVAPPPQSLLTIRCLPLPLFEHFVRYLNRLGAAIDVVCREDHAEQTRALDGIDRVITFDGPTFSMDALGQNGIDAIRARRYDLCVIPRREPTGWGFDNVTPLAEVSGASAAIWLDICGNSGVLAGQRQGWDLDSTGGPHKHGSAYLRRAVSALDNYAPTRTDHSTEQVAVTV